VKKKSAEDRALSFLEALAASSSAKTRKMKGKENVFVIFDNEGWKQKKRRRTRSSRGGLAETNLATRGKGCGEYFITRRRRKM